MKRIYNKETINHIGEKVKVAGWISSRRDHGKIVFLDLRDKTGLLQVVGESLEEKIQGESVVQIEGKVKERPEKMQNKDLETGKVELEIEKIEVLSRANPLPFDLEGELTLPVALDYRPLVLRTPKNKAIFKIEEGITESFRNNVKKMGFTEFHSPTIVPTASEGGSELFPIDYYDKKAYLAQSPQLYKQIMVGVFEKVFTITHAYRAEPSLTTRHIAEYVSLDLEMGFIDSWQELMETGEKIIKGILKDIQKNYQKELGLFSVSLDTEFEIPRIKLKEALEILYKRTKKDQRQEPDLDPEGEREICKYVKEKYNSDFVFITHYPVSKRPFYTYPDPENPELTLSFDLLYKGLEIVTGGQRIHDYNQLLKNIKKWGNDPKDFDFYLQAFKYGMPPEGGMAIGLERVVKQMLSLNNIREAIPFPRDMQRIDQKLNEKE